MRGRSFLAGCLLTVLIFPVMTQAQDHASDVIIPNYRNSSTRSEIPDLTNRRVIRFATTDGYAPFQAVDQNGQPYGLNIDLTRALCEVLQLSCTIQIFTWDDLPKALADGRADAIVAGLRPTEANRKSMDFTRRYLQLPARFAGLMDTPGDDIKPETLAGRSIAVVQGSAHEAFLKAFFADAIIQPFAQPAEAQQALLSGKADFLFGDGVQLATWLGTEEGACCALRGGAYLESRYFGEGFAIGVRRGDERLRDALDHALDAVSANGTFGTIYLKYFPIGIY